MALPAQKQAKATFPLFYQFLSSSRGNSWALGALHVFFSELPLNSNIYRAYLIHGMKFILPFIETLQLTTGPAQVTPEGLHLNHRLASPTSAAHKLQ